MKTPGELLHLLRGLGVVLTLEDDRLRVNAPKGVVTPEMREALTAHKAAVVDLLRQASPSPGANALSHSQQRLWFLAQLKPDDPVYNVAVAMRLVGELDASALEEAVRAIVERHESLRTSFHEVRGRPEAIIEAKVPWKLRFVDLSLLSPAEAEEEAARVAKIEARTPFKLEQAPLLRATLVCQSPRIHLLVLVVHHIVADGWSLGIIAKELGMFYPSFRSQGYVEGEPPRMPPLSLQFQDYLQWEQREGKRLAAAQMPFWLDRLKGERPILEIPADRRRPAVQTFDGRRIAVSLPPALAVEVSALGRDTGITPFMILLAAFKVLMLRYTGITDVLVGSGTSNRHRQEFAALVGFFVNNLVLRTNLAGDPSFREVLLRVQETALSAFAHQDVPFDQLVQGLQPERSTDQSPLVQVVFNLQRVPMEPLALPGLIVQPQALDAEIARADLSVEIWPDGAGYRCDFEYNTNLFEEATVRQMQGHYLRLLAEAVRDPALPIGRIPLLSLEERARMLVLRNHTSSAIPQLSLPALFAEWVEATPDAIALRSPCDTFSYKALDEMANGIAHRLDALGLPAHSFVAVAAEGQALAIAAFLGILKAGHAYLPVSANESVERLRTLLTAASATVLLKLNAGSRFETLDDVEQIDLVDLLPCPEPPRAAAGRSDDPAYLMFTSGSTGEPKGVIVPHRGIVRLVRGVNYLDFNQRSVIAQLAPLSFDGSTIEIWGALLNGGTLVVLNVEQRGPDEVRRAIREFGVDTMPITAALFHATVEERLEELRPLRQMLVGGDVLSTAHLRRLLEQVPHLHLVNAYGPTENTTITCAHTITLESLDDRPIPIGWPIGSTAVFVLDELRQPVPFGVAGELYTSGAGLALGYLNDPPQTEEKFVSLTFTETGTVLAYRTGDLARFRRDGVIEFLGRRDRQVKLRGYRVDLVEVEQAILRSATVQAAIATLREARDGRPALTAYVVPAAPAAFDSQLLRQQLRAILPAHAVPAEIVLVPQIFRTENDKTDFARLNAFADQVNEVRRVPAAEQRFASSTERELAAVFGSLLKTDRVLVEDDFFALGGHSLLVKELIARVGEKFGVQLPVATVFQSSTVRAIAQEIDAARGSQSQAPAGIGLPERVVGREEGTRAGEFGVSATRRNAS